FVPRRMLALINCGVATVAFMVMAALACAVTVWLPIAPVPIVYDAALDVSKTMLLMVIPAADRSMFVLLLTVTAELLNVAVSLTPGAGDALQLLETDQVLLEFPFHVALAAYAELMADMATSPKHKARSLAD